MSVQGQQLEFVERHEHLVAQCATGTANTTIFTPGTTVALLGYTFYANNAGLLAIRLGDTTTNKWLAELAAAGTVNLIFDHPIVMDGLHIQLASATAYRWSILYRVIK